MKDVQKNSQTQNKLSETKGDFCDFSHNEIESEQLSFDCSNTVNISNEKLPIEEINSDAKKVEQIEHVHEEEEKKNGKKKKVFNALFLVLNIVVVAGVLIYQIFNEKITPISDIQNVRFWVLPIIIAAFGIFMLLDTHRTNLFLKASGNRSRPALCYKMCAIGKYYDNITPMSTGGEPAQILYMNHRGLDASSAISVPMARYVVSQISWMILGLVAVFAIVLSGVMDVSVVLIVGLVGFAANFLITSISLLLSLNKKLGNKLMTGVLKFLKKIHIIKNYEKQYERVNGVVEKYQGTMQTYAKNKWLFLYAIFISILVFLVMYTIPFLIYLFFGGKDLSLWLDMMVFSVIIELASSIIPIPGGTGMSEISFTVVFGTIFPEGTVFWGLLIWRLVTYYSFLIQGITIVIYDYFVGNKKFEWLKKKWELEAESIVFQEEKIKKYNTKKKNKKNSI